jgi:hypothetical protein
MNTKRISLGFDLRLNPQLQKETSLHRDQQLIPSKQSPISADPAVWLRTDEVESLSGGSLPDFYNPLYLAKSVDVLLNVCRLQCLSTIGLWPVCLTIYEASTVALVKRYGTGYFENQSGEENLLSQGWRSMGFDVVDLDGMISGLKGCGYAEPTLSQLRLRFGDALNERGLFSDVTAAFHFAEVRGLQIRDHSPFVVVGVLINEPVR